MIGKLYIALALGISLAAIQASERPGKDEDCARARMSFEEYVKKHKRTYVVGSKEQTSA